MHKLKKLSLILGLVIMAMTLFFSTSNTTNNSDGDLTLADLMNINTADAECTVSGGGGCATSSRKCYIVIGGYTITCFNSSPYL